MASTGLLSKADYEGYAEEGKGLAVPPPNIKVKDAVKFVAEMTPIVGDALAAKEIYDELRKKDPNYYLVGALGGAALLGLVPGIGDAAAKLVRKGAKDLVSLAKRIEVDPNAVGMSGGNINLKPKLNSEVFLDTLKKQKDKDDYLYVVHGGDDFEGKLDLGRVGTGEPGEYRPLGTGIYGLVFNPNKPKEALQSLAGAARYGRHYGGGVKQKATENWKGYSDPIYKKIYEKASDGQMLLPMEERLELLQQVYAKYPTRIVEEVIEPPKVHLFRIPKNKLNTININSRVLKEDKNFSYIKELFDSGQVKRGPEIEYKDRYIPEFKKRLKGEAEQKETPDLVIQKLGGEDYIHNEVSMNNPDIVERVGKFDVADTPTYKKYTGALTSLVKPDDYKLMPTIKGASKEIGPQEYTLNESIFDVTGKQRFSWRDSPKAQAKYEGLGIYKGPEGTFESGRPQTSAMQRAAMNPAKLKRIETEEKAARIAAQRKEELTARPRKGPVFDLGEGIRNKLPGGRAQGGINMAQQGMIPLVPNPNMRPPEIKPRSTDDYTPTEGTPMPEQTHPAIKYNTIDDKGNEVEDYKMTLLNKIATGTLGIRQNIEQASDISREFGQNRLDNDVTEDKLRHILLGGLSAKRKVGEPMRKTLLAPLTSYSMDTLREGNDPESNIDKINNQFGRYLREEYPDEKEFIDKAIEAVISTAEGQDYVGKDGKVSAMQPINSIQRQYQGYVMSDEFNELPYNSKYTQLMSMGVDARDVARIIDEPVISDEERKEMQPPTREQLQSGMYKGGALMAQQGVVPMTKAQQDPTGGGPKVAKGRKQTKKPKVQRGLARPVVDPRDEAMKEITQASQQKGAVLPTTQPSVMQASKGVTAITVGIGAPKPDLMEAEKGEPPIGATKEEVADDQHVMMSQGELVVPANVVRYHGLGTYESMRKEALMGLEGMEEAGQIEYVGEEKTSKTNDGGLLKAQSGLALGSTPAAASAQFAGLSTAPTAGINPLSLGRPILDKDGNVIGYEPNTQPTPTQGSGTGLVAPNVGDYKESVKEDFTKPPEGVDTPSAPSTGIGGTGGGGAGFTPAQPAQTSQDYMESFDKNVEAISAGAPTAPTAFQQSDFDSYINVRQPMSERPGIMGKVGGAVDTAAGYILPFTGYQDKKIRESAADKLKNFAFGSQAEYDTLMKTVNLPSLGDTEDDQTLVQKLTDAKKIQFDDDTAKKANEFSAKRDAALKQAKEDMNAPVVFKENTFVDDFLEGPQPSPEAQAAREREKELLASISPDSVGGSGGLSTKEIRELDAKRASDAYNESLRVERDKELAKDMNPIRAAERMRSELPGSDTSQMSNSEREEAQRRREDAERRAASFDTFRQEETERRAEDSAGVNRGDFGGTSTATEGCVIATHGLSTGGFSRLEKAKAEIWCAKTYHGKWYGEAFRRGYRAAGQRCIDSGKAREHYQEFKDFVAYGRGVKKGFGLAITYYLRTVQFFITGLFISE